MQIAADPDTLRSDVDTIAGATISSSAFVNAVQEMLSYTKTTLGIERMLAIRMRFLPKRLQSMAATRAKMQPLKRPRTATT